MLSAWTQYPHLKLRGGGEGDGVGGRRGAKRACELQKEGRDSDSSLGPQVICPPAPPPRPQPTQPRVPLFCSIHHLHFSCTVLYLCQLRPCPGSSQIQLSQLGSLKTLCIEGQITSSLEQYLGPRFFPP